jgi:hypothetical protein
MIRKPKPKPQKHTATIRIKLTPQLYEEVWAQYRVFADINKTATALNLPVSTVKRLVKHGLPEHNLPPLQDKLKELIFISTQLQNIEDLKEYTFLTTRTKHLIQTAFKRLSEKLQSEDYKPRVSDYTQLVNTQLSILKTISTIRGYQTEPPTQKTLSITFQKIITPLQSLSSTNINELSKTTKTLELDLLKQNKTKPESTPQK